MNCGTPNLRMGADQRGGPPNTLRPAGGFTLIEVILALAIFSIVLVSINTVFFAAVRLRERASEAVERSQPLNRAFNVMRRDLQNAVPPGTTMAGHFRSGGLSGLPAGANSNSKTPANKSGNTAATTVLGTGQASGLTFFTSTGIIRDETPWGDIQEVNYELAEPLDRAQATGRDLVRSVNRNLLAMSTQVPEVQRLASNIESLEFSYYDGTQWREMWDTSTSDTTLPTAVRVRIFPAAREGMTKSIYEQPLEMTVLLTCKGAAAQEQASEGGEE